MPLRPLLTEEQIQKRIAEMGAQIAADYPDGVLYLICILKGACYFMADLSRAIPRDVCLDFMGISSYGPGKTTSGEVKITKDLDISLQDVHVLIVEDLIDSGITLGYLMNLMHQRQPKSIRCATLLEKPEHRLSPV